MCEEYISLITFHYIIKHSQSSILGRFSILDSNKNWFHSEVFLRRPGLLWGFINPRNFHFWGTFLARGMSSHIFFKTFQKSTKRYFFQNFSKINKKGFTNTLLVQLWLNGTIFHQKGRLLGQNHCFQNFGAFGVENRSFKGRLRGRSVLTLNIMI